MVFGEIMVYLIDCWLVNNALCSVCIAQSAQSLSMVIVGGRDGCRGYGLVTRDSGQRWSDSLAIMIVLAFPPRLSFRSQVRTESRYGTNTFFSFFEDMSAK